MQDESKRTDERSGLSVHKYVEVFYHRSNPPELRHQCMSSRAQRINYAFWALLTHQGTKGIVLTGQVRVEEV